MPAAVVGSRHHGRTDMAEHEHGTMDIEAHKKTFEGFIRFWVYVFSISAAILIFLAIFNT
jgi:hypothetical protein